MNTLNTLNKKAIIAMMVMSTGIAVSLARAQFQIEHSAKNETQLSKEIQGTVTVYQDDDKDGIRYKVKIINDDIVLASLNGEDFSKDRIKIKDDVLVFMSENGKILHEIKFPKFRKSNDRLHGTHVWSTVQDDGLVGTSENDFVINLPSTPKDAKDGQSIAKERENPPRVMLGITFGEPSKVLRKHLKLNGDVHAILVEKVIEGLPAALAGIEEYDVIVSIDGSEQADGETLTKILSEKEPGDTIKLAVLRGGEKLKIKVKLAKYDAQALGAVTVLSSNMVVNEGDDTTFFSVTGDDMLDILAELEELESQLDKQEESKGREIGKMLRQRLIESVERRDMAASMRAKAIDAMRDAQRQMVEFRDGKLVVRLEEGVEGSLRKFHNDTRDRTREIAGRVIDARMSSMEERLEAIEDQLDRQIDELDEQMDRLAKMFERLMDALEDH